MLRKTEMVIIADLLELAHDAFSRRSCSDYEIPDTPENRKMLEALQYALCSQEEADEYNIEDHTGDGVLFVLDWVLMMYFEKKLREAAKES